MLKLLFRVGTVSRTALILILQTNEIHFYDSLKLYHTGTYFILIRILIIAFLNDFQNISIKGI